MYEEYWILLEVGTPLQIGDQIREIDGEWKNLMLNEIFDEYTLKREAVQKHDFTFRRKLSTILKPFNNIEKLILIFNYPPGTTIYKISQDQNIPALELLEVTDIEEYILKIIIEREALCMICRTKCSNRGSMNTIINCKKYLP